MHAGSTVGGVEEEFNLYLNLSFMPESDKTLHLHIMILLLWPCWEWYDHMTDHRRCFWLELFVWNQYFPSEYQRKCRKFMSRMKEMLMSISSFLLMMAISPSAAGQWTNHSEWLTDWLHELIRITFHSGRQQHKYNSNLVDQKLWLMDALWWNEVEWFASSVYGQQLNPNLFIFISSSLPVLTNAPLRDASSSELNVMIRKLRIVISHL